MVLKENNKRKCFFKDPPKPAGQAQQAKNWPSKGLA
jgi:hypothetical protein